MAHELLNLTDGLDGKPPEFYRVVPLVQQINYQHAGKSISALMDLIAYLRRTGSHEQRRLAADAMKNMILNMGDFEGVIVPRRTRDMRKLALDVIRLAVAGALGSEFQNRELEYLDMYGMNFAYEDLHGVSFRGCFLVECDFQSCYLADSSFSGAYVRKAARSGTLLKCPLDVTGMHRVLKGRYVLPFDSWSEEVQQQLQRTWTTYLHTGGLCATLRRQNSQERKRT